MSKAIAPSEAKSFEQKLINTLILAKYIKPEDTEALAQYNKLLEDCEASGMTNIRQLSNTLHLMLEGHDLKDLYTNQVLVDRLVKTFKKETEMYIYEEQ